MAWVCLKEKDVTEFSGFVNFDINKSITQKGVRIVPFNPHDDTFLKGVANFIERIYPFRVMKKILNKQYYFANDHEVDQILYYVDFFLDPDDAREIWDGKEKRAKLIVERLKEYLREFSYLDLEGFFFFRLKEFGLEYRLLLEQAIDEYLLEKAYQQDNSISDSTDRPKS